MIIERVGMFSLGEVEVSGVDFPFLEITRAFTFLLLTCFDVHNN